MRSALSMTTELLDMPAAAKELADGVSGLAPGANSLGVVFCDSELDDYAGLLGELRARLGFDLIGCTTVAALTAAEGISEMSICLLAMTADDVTFQIELSEPITRENVVEQMYASYGRLAAGGPSEMLLCYPPHNLEIMLDIYPQVLSELSGDLPLFGGLPGSNAPYGVNAVFYNDRHYTDRMLLVGLRGNIRPLFSVGIELSHVTLEPHRVTRSVDNAIFEVDGQPFTHFLDQLGIDPNRLANDDTDILFVANPLMLTEAGRSAEEYRIIRTLHRLDLEGGYGVAIGRIPEGHNITIGSLTRRDISASAEKGVVDLIEAIRQREAADPDYRYSTILASSCVGRYMVMTPRTEVEGDVFKERIPAGMNFAGYYGYGELGPTFVSGNRAVNTSQNESLTLCAF